MWIAGGLISETGHRRACGALRRYTPRRVDHRRGRRFARSRASRWLTHRLWPAGADQTVNPRPRDAGAARRRDTGVVGGSVRSGPNRRAGRSARSRTAGRANRQCRRLARPRSGSRACCSNTRHARTGPTSVITTTSATSSTACGSTSAWCIRAPISKAGRNRLTKRSVRSSITSAASCGSRRASACLMWAAGGAGWFCTRRANTACALSESRCRKTSLRLRTSGSRRKNYPIESKCCCSTTAKREGASAPMRSTRLQASVCSSTSASLICASTSLRSRGCCATAACF